MIKRKVRHGYGYTNMYFDRVLKDHPSSQCGVIVRGDTVEFYSYSTLVITLKGKELKCTGTYSPTTRKQIGWFLKEYAPSLSYYDVKAIAGTDEIIIIK